MRDEIMGGVTGNVGGVVSGGSGGCASATDMVERAQKSRLELLKQLKDEMIHLEQRLERARMAYSQFAEGVGEPGRLVTDETFGSPVRYVVDGNKYTNPITR